MKGAVENAICKVEWQKYLLYVSCKYYAAAIQLQVPAHWTFWSSPGGKVRRVDGILKKLEVVDLQDFPYVTTQHLF